MQSTVQGLKGEERERERELIHHQYRIGGKNKEEEEAANQSSKEVGCTEEGGGMDGIELRHRRNSIQRISYSFCTFFFNISSNVVCIIGVGILGYSNSINSTELYVLCLFCGC